MSRGRPETSGRETSGPGRVRVDRFLDREHGAIVAVGDFGAFLRGYADHARRWDREPDPFGMTLMSQGLAAAVLHLSCRPRDEVCAWTLNLREPPTNVFLAGDAARATVTGRLFTDHVDTVDSSRLFAQWERPHMGRSESTVEVAGLDVLVIFEQYAAQSDQQSARYFELPDGRTAMVVALPDADRDWLAELTREQVAPHVQGGGASFLDEVHYRFACGCTEEKLVEVVRALHAGQLDELFQGDDAVEVQCPRCGRRWDLLWKDVKES